MFEPRDLEKINGLDMERIKVITRLDARGRQMLPKIVSRLPVGRLRIYNMGPSRLYGATCEKMPKFHDGPGLRDLHGGDEHLAFSVRKFMENLRSFSLLFVEN